MTAMRYLQSTSEFHQMERFYLRPLGDGRVEVRWNLGKAGKGTGSQWVKALEGVDQTKENGFAFQGTWLSQGSIVTPPVAILGAFATGSWRHPFTVLFLLILRSDNPDEWEVREWPWNTKGERAIAVKEVAEALSELGLQAQGQEEVPAPALALARELLKRAGGYEQALRALEKAREEV